MNEPFVRVLGSADWHQTAHNDHSCYTVSDRILIDACPSVVTQLQEAGVDPLDVHLVFVTHMHCDHYMGLAPLMHYWRVCRQTDLSGLTIAGPRETVQDYVDFTLRFVFRDKLDACVTRMPRILPLGEGDTLHHAGYAVHVHEADHAVPARSYRLVHEESGRSVGFTGDTRYQQSLPGFFRDVDLLLHEVSLGAGPVDPVHNAGCRHSSAQEAVRVCRESGARRLLLTHCYEGKRQTALDEARRLLDRSVDWAMPGSVFPF